MRIIETPLNGVYEIDIEKINDSRGFFARLFCEKTFAEQGLDANFVQVNSSLSVEKGTLRGLHYQLPPRDEVKLVRCIQGAFYDVVVDLRPTSPTFSQSYGTTLSVMNRKMMYIPKGCAHGFLTLEPNSEVLYFVSNIYSKELERGVRWDDSKFNVSWPFPPVVLSERDQAHPDFDPHYHLNHEDFFHRS